ncbi:MAG TPA: EAL domain-containing protein, partial [Spongiibacteraceae bacterium]|nr:EAL domain-containing protein [Spongiibacteraceae bacterium]
IYNRGQVMERDASGNPLRVIGTVTDISEHKQAQLEMAKLTERFTLATDAARVGIWEWDIEDNVLMWDARMFELCGLEPDSVVPTYALWLSKVHPLDRDAADRAVKVAINGDAQLNIEFRVVWPDGELHYLCALATVIRDTDGKAVRMVGTNWDISELRFATEALHEEKERLHVTLYSIGEAVITTDEQARITFMNPVAENLTGWPLAEAIGLAVDEVFKVIDGESNEAIAHPVFECLNDRRVFTLDEGLALLSRDGERHDIQNSAAPVRTLHGEIIGAVLVFKNVSKSRELLRKLSFNATHDPLTGLFNRVQFEIELTRAVNHARTQQTQHVLCFIDLDRFKIVNDTAGHAIGDTLLRELGVLLRRHIRTSDILARLGGDEFGLLMFDCELEKAREILDKLIADIVALRFPWGGRVYDIGASVGVVVIDAGAVATAELMSHADMACYTAKRAGGNRMSVFAVEGSGDQQRESVLAAELRTATANNRFVLYAQPIVPLRPVEHPTNQYELLLRMLDADGNAILPNCFMGTAARFGLMADIDRWVVREVLERQAEKIARLPHATININLSAAAISDPLFLPYVNDLLERAPLDAGVLQFEISETTMMSALSATTRLIAKLRARGCKVALDNFGSGLGAFYYLKNFRIDTIKIDGGFVRNMAHNSIDRTIVEAINKVAHQLAAMTVAECVESKATLKVLRTLKLDYAQGNAIEAPRPLADILAEKAGSAKVEPLRIIRPKT